MDIKEIKKITEELGIRECCNFSDKYGCRYCADAVLVKKSGGGYSLMNYGKSESEGSKIFCPYEECLYKEDLDPYHNYLDYLRRGKGGRRWIKMLGQ